MFSRVAFVLLSLTFPLVSHASECATVQVIQGEVLVGNTTLTEHSSVDCGATVITKAGGSVILQFSGGRMILGGSSRVDLLSTIRETSDVITVDRSSLEAINLIYGQVRIACEKTFLVRSPGLLTQGQNGADFYVAHGGTAAFNGVVVIQSPVEVKMTDSAPPLDLHSGQQMAEPARDSTTLAPSMPLNVDVRQEVRRMSLLGRSDYIFTGSGAVAMLGTPANWTKTPAEEGQQAKIETQKRRLAERKERHLRLIRGSYYQHQTDAYKWEANYDAEIGFFSVPVPNLPISATDFILTLGPEYGISEMFSVGLTIGYSVESTSSSVNGTAASATSSGLVDPMLYFNGRKLLGTTLLKFGGSVAGGLTSSTSTGSGSTKFNDGFTVIPYVGAERELGAGRLGARISYEALKTGRNLTISGATFSLAGGQGLRAIVFWEQGTGDDNLWGADIGLVTYSALTVSAGSGGGLTQAQQAAISGTPVESAITTPQVEIYYSIAFGDKYRLTPTLSYSAIQAFGTTLKGVYLSVPLRHSF